MEDLELEPPVNLENAP